MSDNNHLPKRHPLAQQTAAAADISARLNRSRKQAGLLSLSAKNLSVLAVRIGQQAAGLKVLSLFYDEFAQSAIVISNEINRLVARIALDSVSRWRREMFSNKVTQVLESDPLYSTALLMAKKQHVVTCCDEFRLNTQQYCRQLDMQLEELFKFMQSMQVIAVNARIEAGSIPEYQRQMDGLSEKIDQSTAVILEDVHICKSLIKEIL
ncbi:hypothetical protein [Shewanella aestuarii]|uniref:Chemotaxis protein n=1 Tax=Shewanella aestuarii TaxID=1028752 RepID=A0A6G9QQL8_9GAMM|nr:hypothetical protein [Shewanella aestuarii]QIR16403.1 hypothetical protein HBH39_18170 [Shewanella aestuarii]